MTATNINTNNSTTTATSNNTNANTTTTTAKITTLIFDVDDTLYDVGTGFTAHRNGDAVQKYMVEHLKFPNMKSAKSLRDKYFKKYHATAKALTVAQDSGDPNFPKNAPKFDTGHLAEYWANNLDYTLLGPPKTQLYDQLKNCPLTLIAFSNGPRAYVKRVLQELGLFDLFGDERLYAVDDVLPYCKPEKEAFEKIFDDLANNNNNNDDQKIQPENCIMVEDSMKNIRRAKEIGMKTVLITGKKKSTLAEDVEGHRILPEDAPETTDPAVDCSMETIEEFPTILSGLWETPTEFEPQYTT